MTGERGTERIRLMIVEDNPDFRNLMKALLGRQSDMELVAQAGSLTEARAHIATLQFDVVILDLGLPDGNGADLIADLRRANPNVGVLILSATLDPGSLQRATEAEANVIMDKIAPLDEILGAIRRLGSA